MFNKMNIKNVSKDLKISPNSAAELGTPINSTLIIYIIY